jgi:hypothetical protein
VAQSLGSQPAAALRRRRGSGTAARHATYRKLGTSNEDFATSYVVNSSVSYVLPLILPSVGLARLSTQSDVPGAVWTLALIGLGPGTVLEITAAAS